MSGRRQVAQVYGKPIYLITDVAFIPLSSRRDAEDAIAEAQASARKTQHNDSPLPELHVEATVDPECDASAPLEHDPFDEQKSSPVQATASSQLPWRNEQGIGADVIASKGLHGRLAGRWLSTQNWTMNHNGREGNSSSEDFGKSRPLDRRKSVCLGDVPLPESQKRLAPVELTPPMSAAGSDGLAEAISSSHPAVVLTTIVPKLLHTMYQLLTSNTLYFSYNYDITRTFDHNKDSLLRPFCRGDSEVQVSLDSSISIIGRPGLGRCAVVATSATPCS